MVKVKTTFPLGKDRLSETSKVSNILFLCKKDMKLNLVVENMHFLSFSFHMKFHNLRAELVLCFFFILNKLYEELFTSHFMGRYKGMQSDPALQDA